jgi:hypothetical protein
MIPGSPFFQADGDVEIVQALVILLAGDKFNDVGVVHPENAHVGSPPRPSLFNRFRCCVENGHERYGT